MLVSRDKEASTADTRLDDDSSSTDGSVQAGVKSIEAISATWTKWSLACAYIGYVSTSAVTLPPHGVPGQDGFEMALHVV